MKEYLCEYVKFPVPGESISKKLELYIELLKNEKRFHNIIGTANFQEMLKAHIIPSVALAVRIAGVAGIDIGSGNGLPGIVIAAVRPGIDMTLMEPRLTRVYFLDKTAKSLGLGNVSVVRKRAEKAGNDRLFREQFDFATCRAVAEFPAACELALPLIRVGGRFYAQPGQEIEIEKFSDRIELLGGTVAESSNGIAVINKTRPTPSGYPRSWNRIR